MDYWSKFAVLVACECVGVFALRKVGLTLRTAFLVMFALVLAVACFVQFGLGITTI